MPGGVLGGNGTRNAAFPGFFSFRVHTTSKEKTDIQNKLAAILPPQSKLRRGRGGDCFEKTGEGIFCVGKREGEAEKIM